MTKTRKLLACAALSTGMLFSSMASAKSHKDPKPSPAPQEPSPKADPSATPLSAVDVSSLAEQEERKTPSKAASSGNARRPMYDQQQPRSIVAGTRGKAKTRAPLARADAPGSAS